MTTEISVMYGGEKVKALIIFVKTIETIGFFFPSQLFPLHLNTYVMGLRPF